MNGNEVLTDVESPMGRASREMLPSSAAFPLSSRFGDLVIICGSLNVQIENFAITLGNGSAETKCWSQPLTGAHSWTLFNTFPQALIGSAQATFRDSIWYVIGGYHPRDGTFSHEILALHQHAQDWKVIGEIPTGLAGACAVIHGNHVFVSGGHVYDRVFTEVWSFDVSNPEWKEVGKMKVARSHHACAAVEIGNTWVMTVAGGFHMGVHNSLTVLKSVEAIALGENGDREWGQMADLSTPRLGSTMLEDEDSILMIGGFNEAGTLGTCEELNLNDPSAWQMLEQPCLKRSRGFFTALNVDSPGSRSKRDTEGSNWNTEWEREFPNLFANDIDNFYSSEEGDKEDYLAPGLKENVFRTLNRQAEPDEMERDPSPISKGPSLDNYPKFTILMGGMEVMAKENADQISQVTKESIQQSKVTLPQSARMVIAGYLSGHLVICGGTRSPYTHTDKLGDLKVESDCFYRSPSSDDEWIKFGPMPTKVLATSHAVTNNTLYIIDRYILTIGGHNATGYHNCLEIYDTRKHERFYKGIWKLNIPRAYHACSVVHGFMTESYGLTDAILCAGGVSQSESPNLDVLESIEYWLFGKFIDDKKRHKWHLLTETLKKPRFGLSMIALENSRTLFLGGLNFQDESLASEVLDSIHEVAEMDPEPQLDFPWAFATEVHNVPSGTLDWEPISLSTTTELTTTSDLTPNNIPDQTKTLSSDHQSAEAMILSEVDVEPSREFADDGEGFLLLEVDPQGNGTTMSDFIVPGQFRITNPIKNLPKTSIMSIGGYFPGSKLIVLCGGYNSTASVPQIFSHGENMKEPQSDCFAYSLASKTWHKIPPMKVPLAEAAHVMVGNMLYIFGGIIGALSHPNDGHEPCPKRSKSIFSWNVFTLEVDLETKTKLFNCSNLMLPMEQAGGCALNTGDEVFLVGGRNSWRILRNGVKFKVIESVLAGQEDLPPLNEGRSSFACAQVDWEEEQKALLVGGGFTLGFSSRNELKTVEILILTSEGSNGWLSIGELVQARFGLTIWSQQEPRSILIMGGFDRNGPVEIAEIMEPSGNGEA
eukprot:maker-scaffold119_size336447-snap-gene-2.32 protein:Tk11787 transcript:maker-scaffold119_size336447-snap-gene-2.32-mRNA-1 annotation:"kelch-like protein 10-like"